VNESTEEKMYKVLLGLGDLKLLHYELSKAIGSRLDRIKQSGKLEKPGKNEVCFLASIDRLKCAIRDRCQEITKLPDMGVETRKNMENVQKTLGRLGDISLDWPPT